jgi:hypothetical protein
MQMPQMAKGVFMDALSPPALLPSSHNSRGPPFRRRIDQCLISGIGSAPKVNR